MLITKFKNRIEAGTKLVKYLKKYQGQNTIVLGIPRGGIIPASVVAKHLTVPLGLIIVRKIAHPYNPEYAIAAIGESGKIITGGSEINSIDQSWFKAKCQNQLLEAKRRRAKYLGKHKNLKLRTKTVILIDDGLATGLTMEAAIDELKAQKPAKIIIAVPVTPLDAFNKLSGEVDDFISLIITENFRGSVGAYYDEFPQVEDQEVVDLINTYTS